MSFLVNFLFPNYLKEINHWPDIQDHQPIKRIIDENELDVSYVYSVMKYARPIVESGFKILYLYVHYLSDEFNYVPQSSDNDTLWFAELEKSSAHKTIAICCTAYPQPNHITDPSYNNPRTDRLFSYLNTGTGLGAISALYPFADKINVYGWDFYLESSPENMWYWELFFNTYRNKYDKRTWDHFESALINFYYGYHLSKLPKVNVYGHLGQLENHKKMINRIERVLFD